jgi:hypothetical protein
VKSTIPSDEIKEAILQHCPRLTGFQLEDITGAIVVEFLYNIADMVSQLVFRYNLPKEMIKTTSSTSRFLDDHHAFQHSTESQF